tara:strand:- start:373 stop:600 length:228 start_codon:yes stop_codon:yes gene_type:complete
MEALLLALSPMPIALCVLAAVQTAFAWILITDARDESLSVTARWTHIAAAAVFLTVVVALLYVAVGTAGVIGPLQ